MDDVKTFVSLLKGINRPSLNIGLDIYYLIGMEETEGGEYYEAFFASELGIVLYALIPCNPIEAMNHPIPEVYHRCPHYENRNDLIALWHRFKANPVLSWCQTPYDFEDKCDLSTPS